MTSEQTYTSQTHSDYYSPYSCVRAGDPEADLFNDSVHYVIVGLNGRMNDHLNLHVEEHQTERGGEVVVEQSLYLFSSLPYICCMCAFSFSGARAAFPMICQ